MIRALDEDVRSLLRSGIAVSSLTQCIDELVVNSLDAGATCITVRLDVSALRLQVSDNGSGISKDNLEVLGERYSTSKCHSLKDLDNLKFYGFRGEAVASIRDIAGNLEIVTRHKSSYKTYCKAFKTGQAGMVTEACIPRSNVGTTVTLYDIFSTLPVRRKLVSDVLEVERIRHRLSSIALINPSVSFSLYNDTTGQKCLQTRKCQSVVSTFSQLFGNLKAKSLHEMSADSDDVKVCGFVGLQTHNSKNLQFVYINGRLLMKTRIHKLVNHILNKSLLIKKPGLSSNNTAEIAPVTSPKQTSDKYGIYVLNITCPYMTYDITLEPAKTLVEFEDWDKVLNLISRCIESFLINKNLLSATDVTDDAEESQDSCDSQLDLSVYEYQSDTTKQGYCIDASNIRKSLHSSLVSRKPKQGHNARQSRDKDALTGITELQSKEEVSKVSVMISQAGKEYGNASAPVSKISVSATPLSVPGQILTTARKSNAACFTSPNPITLKPRKSNRKVHFGSQKKYRKLSTLEDETEKTRAQHGMDKSDNTKKDDLRELDLSKYNATKKPSLGVNTEKHEDDSSANYRNATNDNSNESIQTVVDYNVDTSMTLCKDKAIGESKVSLVDKESKQEEFITQANLESNSNDTAGTVVNDGMTVVPDKTLLIADSSVNKNAQDNCISTNVFDKQFILPRNASTESNACLDVSYNSTVIFDKDKMTKSGDGNMTYDSQAQHKNNTINAFDKKADNCTLTFDDNGARQTTSGSISSLHGICPLSLNSNIHLNSVLNTAANINPDTVDNHATRRAADVISSVGDFCHSNINYSVSNSVADIIPITFDTNTSKQAANEGLSSEGVLCQASIHSNINSVSNTVADDSPFTFDNNITKKVTDDVIANACDVWQAGVKSNNNTVSTTVANSNPRQVTDDVIPNACDVRQANVESNLNTISNKVANSNTRQINIISNVSDIWQAKYDSNLNKTIFYNINTGNTVFECPYSQDTASHGNDDSDEVSKMAPLACAPHVSFDYTPWLPRDGRHKRTSNQETNDQPSSHVSSMLDQWVNPVFESSSEMDVTSLSKPTARRTSLLKAILPYRFTKDMVKALDVIQQVDNKFIVCQVQHDNQQIEHNGLVVLLDQHAVHERIRLERLTADLFISTTQPNSSLPSIKSSPVSPPIEIEFAPNDLLLIKRFRGELGRVGVKFVIGCSSESIESRSVIVHELPCVFVEREVSETRRRRPSVALSIVKDLIESHVEHLRQTNGVSPAIPKTISRVLSSQACHGAIKFGDPLTQQECQQLIQQLSTCDLPFQCAHGRPSIVPLIDIKLLDSIHLPLEVDEKPQLSRLVRGLKNEH